MTLTLAKQMLIDAVHRSLGASIKQMGSVFVAGLIDGESIDLLAARFRHGLPSVIAAHDRMAVEIEDHFASQEPSP